MLLVSATSLSSRILVRTDRQFDLKYEIICQDIVMLVKRVFEMHSFS